MPAPQTREIVTVGPTTYFLQGKPANYGKTIGEVVYQAMIDVMKVPKNDRFQVITEHAVDNSPWGS